MQSIHITTLRKILDSPEPIDIRLWTRSGEIQSWHRCISLKYDFYKGTRSICFCNKINICGCMADIVYLWFYRIYIGHFLVKHCHFSKPFLCFVTKSC